MVRRGKVSHWGIRESDSKRVYVYAHEPLAFAIYARHHHRIELMGRIPAGEGAELKAKNLQTRYAGAEIVALHPSTKYSEEK